MINYFRNLKARLAVILTAMIAMTTVFPMSAFADEAMPEVVSEAYEIEYADEIVTEAEIAEAEIVEDEMSGTLLTTEDNSEVSNETDIESEETLPIIPLGDETFTEVEEESDENSGEFSIMAAGETAGAKITKYYNQPSFYTADGHDAIQFFIVENGAYTGKCYFVISQNSTSKNWLLYNYKQETASLYFTKTDLFNSLYVPTNKESTRTDNAATVSIDEAKVPLMSKADFNGMYCNWRDFSDIPFMKDADGKLMYATYEVDDTSNNGNDNGNGGNDNGNGSNTNPGNGNSGNNGGDNGNGNGNGNGGNNNTDPGNGNNNPGGNTNPENGNPTNPGDNSQSGNNPSASTNSWSNSYYRYTVSLNSGNTYRVYITKAVSYNGTKHTLEGTKAGKKKTPDIKILVYLNGQVVDSSLYKVKFYYNQNTNKYKGEKKVPCAVLNFKFKNKALKADKKAFKRKAFGFDIRPLDLRTGTINFEYKKNGAVKKATFVSANGLSIKMNTKKDYQVSSDGNKTYVTGVGNYTGTISFNSAVPTNNYGGNNGGIY